MRLGGMRLGARARRFKAFPGNNAAIGAAPDLDDGGPDTDAITP